MYAASTKVRHLTLNSIDGYGLCSLKHSDKNKFIATLKRLVVHGAFIQHAEPSRWPNVFIWPLLRIGGNRQLFGNDEGPGLLLSYNHAATNPNERAFEVGIGFGIQ